MGRVKGVERKLYLHAKKGRGAQELQGISVKSMYPQE